MNFKEIRCFLLIIRCRLIKSKWQARRRAGRPAALWICVLELAYLEMRAATGRRARCPYAKPMRKLCENYAKTMPRGLQDVPKATRRLQDDPRHLQDGP